MDPATLMGGAPSYSGGDSGPAYSEAGSTATQQADFTVYGSGSSTTQAIRWGGIILLGLGALWLASKK